MKSTLQLVQICFDTATFDNTPELGSICLPDYYNERHEYTAVIELPYNISDVMGDGALIVDVEVVLDNLLDSQVQFLSTALMFGHSQESWFEAEGICVSKGGHLASAASTHQWQRLQNFLAENGVSDELV